VNMNFPKDAIAVYLVFAATLALALFVHPPG
jgi:hypothetical protein